jgi:predicted PurR-regulated permease PerM
MDSPYPPPGDGGSRAQQVATGVLAAVFVALGVYTLWNFWGALAWAAIFAIALWPLYERALARFGGGRGDVLWPGLFTLAVALIFIVPLGFVGSELARESHAITDWVRNAQSNGIAEPELLHHLPFGQAYVDDWWKQNLTDPGSAADLLRRTASGRVGDLGRTIGVQVARRLTWFVFTLLTLFFLFRDGHGLVRQARRVAVHTFGPGGERVARQIVASVRGTVNGLVLVGLGEGVLLGAVYAVAGVPHPTVLGALTAVAAIIPFAGPVVFCLAALLLAAQGDIAWAIAVVAVGLVVTFVADHFVRPVLIGGSTKLPFIWVLMGILGGVEMWGLLGLFLGPAIMAALILLWREWACEPENAA